MHTNTTAGWCTQVDFPQSEEKSWAHLLQFVSLSDKCRNSLELRVRHTRYPLKMVTTTSKG
jgi:hypothetical protein